eukprot:UN26592
MFGYENCVKFANVKKLKLLYTSLNLDNTLDSCIPKSKDCVILSMLGFSGFYLFMEMFYVVFLILLYKMYWLFQPKMKTRINI